MGVERHPSRRWRPESPRRRVVMDSPDADRPASPARVFSRPCHLQIVRRVPRRSSPTVSAVLAAAAPGGANDGFTAGARDDLYTRCNTPSTNRPIRSLGRPWRSPNDPTRSWACYVVDSGFVVGLGMRVARFVVDVSMIPTSLS